MPVFPRFNRESDYRKQVRFIGARPDENVEPERTRERRAHGAYDSERLVDRARVVTMVPKDGNASPGKTRSPVAEKNGAKRVWGSMRSARMSTGETLEAIRQRVSFRDPSLEARSSTPRPTPYQE